jgi:hypothetical protein
MGFSGFIVGVGFRTLKRRLDEEGLEGQEGFSSLANAP